MTGVAFDVEAGARHRPVRAVLALAAVSLSTTVAGGLLLGWIAPRSDETLRRLAVVILLLVLSVVVARRVGWSAVAAAGPGTWWAPGWLVVPIVLALVPLAWGWSPDPGTLLVLAVGYAATGVYEELWFRGIMLRAALALGAARAAALSAAVFGASHLANVVFGQNAVITAAQAVGAAAFGFGYAVLRLRTNAVWALAATHALLDLLLHTTGLHGGALWGVMVGQDLLLLAVGLIALPRPGTAPRSAARAGSRTHRTGR
ncbi:MAG TPA: CPBP family glutamic-type intramembrane protease [Angustibacter sp.]|nr:CPBP family glutamic-type intramembrane protease [Angustibacter sp.]